MKQRKLLTFVIALGGSDAVTQFTCPQVAFVRSLGGIRYPKEGHPKDYAHSRRDRQVAQRPHRRDIVPTGG